MMEEEREMTQSTRLHYSHHHHHDDDDEDDIDDDVDDDVDDDDYDESMDMIRHACTIFVAFTNVSHPCSGHKGFLNSLHSLDFLAMS